MWPEWREERTWRWYTCMYMYLPHWQSISSPDLLCQLDKLWWILLLNISPRETKGQLMWAHVSRLYTSPGLLPLFLWQSHSLASLASSTLRNHSQPNHKRQIDTHTPTITGGQSKSKQGWHEKHSLTVSLTQKLSSNIVEAIFTS